MRLNVGLKAKKNEQPVAAADLQEQLEFLNKFIPRFGE
jgi:hypothetical protein